MSTRTDAERTRVAVLQAASVPFDQDATLDRLETVVAEAAAAGAQLVVAPEAFLGGYPQGLTFAAVLGARATSGHELYRRYWAGAVDIPGLAFDRIAATAARHRIYLVTGVVERVGGTLYCTVLFLGPSGKLLGQHRKLVPTGSERLVWGRGDGSTLPVIDTPVGPHGSRRANPRPTRAAAGDLDLHSTVRGHFDLDVNGHYARPDLFRWTVDQTARDGVPPRI